MKDYYPFKQKVSILIASITGLLLVSCGSYQPSSYDDDGIYSSEERTIASNETTPTDKNAKYYEDYFGKNVNEYGEIEEDEVFTDVDNYSSQNTSEAKESYSSWEDADDNVTINVYNNNPYFYGSYYRPFNYWNRWNTGWGYGYYNDFYCGFNTPFYGYGYNNPYFYGSYYGHNPYYNGYYGQNYYYGRNSYAYVNGRRRSAYNNSYYGRNANRLGNSRLNRNTRARTPRTSHNATPRSTTRPRSTPHSTPRTKPRSTKPRTTRPRTTPRSTTPRSTPRSTRPRSTPRSTPRSAPRSYSPRSNSRGSSSGSSRRGRL